MAVLHLLRRPSPRAMMALTARSFWKDVKMSPPDPIFGVTDAFQKAKAKKKVNLGVGAYRGDDGKPYVLQAVRQAEQIVVGRKLNKEYLPMAGDAKFVAAAVKLAFAETAPVKAGLNASAQSLSGTGALFVLARFINIYMKGNKVIYMPNPTWGNHKNIFTKAGVKQAAYTYYHPKTRLLDFKGALADIAKIPRGSVLLLHACAHNPTGVDPTRDQWKEISDVAKKRGLLIFFDMAYQGFATGDVDNDAFAPRLFAAEGHPVLVAQSFAKNMGLYGERVGCMSIVCRDEGEQRRVHSQLKMLIRAVYSNPPLHGARIAAEVLTNAKLRALWLQEVKGMADRVIKMRKQLRSTLEKLGTKHSWGHITKQIGMFCFTGLTPAQVAQMAERHSVFHTKDGRISVVGLTTKNVEHVAKAIHDVTK